MTDRTGRPYQVIQHPRTFIYPDGSRRVVIRVQLVSAARQLRKRFGISGRQWTKLRKAALRAAKMTQQGLVTA